MIAIVTSCINPKQSKNIKSFVPLKERIEQTLYSLERLKAVGFTQIILVDNSFQMDFNSLKTNNKDIKIVHLRQYQFSNKGINEILMILTVLEEIADDTPIFKISGRYYPNDHFKFEFDSEFDLMVRSYNYLERRGTISTRAYFVKNKVIYEDFLLKTMNEVFIYKSRIVGLRTLNIQIKNIFSPNFSKEMNISIEFAAARVLKNGSHKVKLLEPIGVSGQVAGFESRMEIIE